VRTKPGAPGPRVLRRVDWAHRRIGTLESWIRRPKISMYAVAGDAPGSKTSTQVLEECGWSTQVEVCVARHTKFVQHGYAETSSGVKFKTQTIVGPGLLYNIRLWLCGSASQGRVTPGQRVVVSVAGPYSHQTWRGEASAASAWSMRELGSLQRRR
jgi:hypothetical protein